MTESFLVLMIIFGVGYALLIGIFTLGFYKIPEYSPGELKEPISVSVVVAVRNESGQILKLLESISGQLIKNIKFEALIVDDHSDDNTTSIVRDFLETNPGLNLRLLETEPGQEGKKAALARGIESAKGSLILTTDGDCQMDPLWVAGYVSYYARYKPKLISGPVVYERSGGFFSAFSSMEFLSLIGSGAGAIGAGAAIMCNGANMAFEKQTYQELMKFDPSQKYKSGDDVFFLHAVKNKYGSSNIRFLKDKGAIVTTIAPKGLLGLLNQRFRWVSKSRGYQDLMTILTTFVVFFFSFFTLLLFVISLFLNEFFLPFFILFFVKILVDFPIIAGICSFLGRIGLLWYYLPVQVLHIPFIVFTGIAGNLTGFSWKGRKNQS